jgi:hypothetical protein
MTPSSVRFGLPLRRCSGVAPLAPVGADALPWATMERSDSQSTFSLHFLSLWRPSRLALAVSAAGVDRVSQVPDCSFLTCHALRPRQAKLSLTCGGLARVGFRERRLRPHLRVCSVSGLNCLSRVRVLLAAREFPCVRLQEVVRPGGFRRFRYLSFLSATRGLGRLVRPFHSFLSFRILILPSALRDFHPQSSQASLGAPPSGAAPRASETAYGHMPLLPELKPSFMMRGSYRHAAPSGAVARFLACELSAPSRIACRREMPSLPLSITPLLPSAPSHA